MSEISKYITIIRPEFMAFCKDACRAAALNHLLFRIAGKSKDQPRENIQAGKILWYAKTELITSEMSEAWGVCKVRKEVNGLVDMGLIGKKSNPTWGVDRTKHFCFGSEQCEVFLKYCEDNGICVVHLDLPVEVKHLIYLSLANDKSIKCTCEKGDSEFANDKSITCIRYIHPMHSINLSDAFDKSIGTITKTTTKTSNKDNSKEDTGDSAGEHNSTPQPVADATTPAPSSSQSLNFVEAREYLTALGYKLEPTPQAYNCEEPGKALWSVSEPNAHHLFDTLTTTKIKQLATRLKERAHQPEKPASEKSEQDSVATPELSTLTGTSPQTSAKVEKKQGKTGSQKKEPEPPVFTPEGQKVYDAWASLFKSPPRAAEKTADCANDLYARLVPWCKDLNISCKQLLSDIKGWCYITDPDWYRRKGVTLCDIGAQFERWQSAKTEEIESEKAKNAPKQRELTPIEKMRAERARYTGGVQA